MAQQSKANLRYHRQTAQKMRLIADLVRGKGVNEAYNILSFTQKKAAGVVLKLLKSAVANAEQTGKVDIDTLFIKAIQVNEGPNMPARFRPRAHGRATPIRKRTSHVELVLEEK